MRHTALLLLIFIAFCVLNSIVSYDQSKRVIKVGAFDRSNFWECKNVEVSISSKTIKVVLPGHYSQHHVIYIQNRNVSFCSISRDYIPLQALCQIFVDRHA
jgi:hypothetical protein